MLVFSGSLIILHRGHLRGASILTVIGLGSLLIYVAATNGGVNTPAYGGLIVTVLCAGLLLGPRWAMIASALSITSGLILLYAEANGWLPPAPPTNQSLNMWMAQAVYMITAGLMINLGIGTISKALRRARREITEREQTEKEFRRNKILMQAVIDQAPFDLWICDAEGRYLFQNAGGRILTGDAIGKRPSELDVVPPELRQRWEAEHNIALSGQRYQNQSTDIINGTPVTAIVNIGPVVIDDEIAALIGIAVDVSPIKKAEEEVRTLNATLEKRVGQLRTLNEISRAVSTVKDLNETLEIIYQQIKHAMPCDAFYVSMYDPLTQKTSFPIFYDEGKPYHEPDVILSENSILTNVQVQGETILDLSEEGSKETDEIILGNPDRIPPSIMIAPLIAGNRIIGAISAQSYTAQAYTAEDLELLQGIASQAAIAIENARLFESLRRELAERKQAENALHESEARLRATFNNIPFDLWVCDANGRYIMQNPISMQLGGVLIGKRVQDLNMPAEVLREWEQFHAIALSGDIVRTETITEIMDEKRNFFITLAPINDEGRSIGFVGINMDITNIKRAEEEVRRLNAQLEERVHERTAQLEAANQELESFSYSVSHDLRAPLRAVNGFARILLNDFADSLNEAGKAYLQKIVENGNRMGELIDDLLAFSRLGRQAIVHSPLDLGAMARAVFDDLSRDQPPDHVIRFSVLDLLPARGDESLIKQVLINLIGNAIKFSQYKAVTQIEIGSTLTDHGTAYFVRDNGAGFDMRYVNKIFGVFQRLHNDDSFEGTGVGLAIVQRIIHKHGGEIWAEGKLDEGATFYFTLGDAGLS
jgi:PAS domain S-box-containing protein